VSQSDGKNNLMKNRLLLTAILAIAAGCSDFRSPAGPAEPLFAARTDAAAIAAPHLVDEFVGTAIRLDQWNFYQQASWVSQDDQLVVQPVARVAAYGGLISRDPYPITGNTFFAEISRVATGSSTTETLIALSSLDEEEYAVITSFNGRISAWRKWRDDPDFHRVGSDMRLNTTNHRFRRIREANGILFFELSADGFAWSSPSGWSIAHQFSEIGQLHAAVAAGPWLDDNNNPTPAHFQNVNTTVPAIPRNIRLKRLTSTSIEIGWEDHAVNETGFRIERRLPGGSFSEVATVGANVVTFIDTELQANAGYEYRVRAHNSSGNSGYSGVGALGSVPAAPGNLAATSRSAVRIDLTWSDNSGDETGFRIERKSAGGQWTMLATTAANATSYRDEAGEGGITYTFRVQAMNAGGASAWSNEVTATTYPAAPNNVHAAAASASILLTWVPGSPADGHEIQRSVAGGRFRSLATVGGSSSSFTDSGVTGGETYAYRIRAFNHAGQSSWEESGSATAPLPSPPAAPSGLTLRARSESRIDVSWTDNSEDETGFQIERRQGQSAWITLATTGVNATSFRDNGVEEARSYTYRVRSINNGGASAWSAEETAMTPPAAPTSITTDSGGGGQINVSWVNGSVGATGFEIQRRIGTGSFRRFASVDATATAIVDTGLVVGESYTYRIRATNEGGSSAWTEGVTVVAR
jgi:hypothetical protein